MGSSISTLYSILMTESALSKTNTMTNQSFSPRIYKHFNHVTRSSTNKNMRRNHQIKQPGYDVQRKHSVMRKNPVQRKR